MSVLYLSLGSNQGDRRALLDEAVRLIGLRVGTVEAVARYVETEPWGFDSAYTFINTCVRVRTRLDAWQVLEVTQQIERMLGRTVKSEGGIYHDRTIDIDLLMMYDGPRAVAIDDWREVNGRRQRLVLPHPLMEQRDFVMVPLREVIMMH